MTARRTRVMVTGSRGWTDAAVIRHWVDGLDKRRVVIVHGAARGPDRIAGDYAESRGYKVEAWPADWERYGKAAGPIRNVAMIATLDAAAFDYVKAFWDGTSPGTRHAIDEALRVGLSVYTERCGRLPDHP